MEVETKANSAKLTKTSILLLLNYLIDYRLSRPKTTHQQAAQTHHNPSKMATVYGTASAIRAVAKHRIACITDHLNLWIKPELIC